MTTTEWIPCNERLPKKGIDSAPDVQRGWYLVTHQSGAVTMQAYEFSDDKRIQGWHVPGSPVVAWSHLPEAYKKPVEQTPPKTLDEVIEGLKNCTSGDKDSCEECEWLDGSIGTFCCSLAKDSFEWIKWLRTQNEYSAKVIGECEDEIEKLAEAKEPHLMSLDEVMRIYNTDAFNLWPYNTPPYLFVQSNSQTHGTHGVWANWEWVKAALEGLVLNIQSSHTARHGFAGH